MMNLSRTDNPSIENIRKIIKKVQIQEINEKNDAKVILSKLTQTKHDALLIVLLQMETSDVEAQVMMHRSEF